MIYFVYGGTMQYTLLAPGDCVIPQNNPPINTRDLFESCFARLWVGERDTSWAKHIPPYNYSRDIIFLSHTRYVLSL
jgi:hypothetical protein